jgi:hypothetical protein
LFIVPPCGYIHAFFDPEEDGYELFLLYDNPVVVPPGQTLHYDTKARNMTKNKISSCAKVEEFNKIIVYSIPSNSHNVLLKYKGNEEVQTRKGDAMGRVGFMGRLKSSRSIENGLDYATNIDEISIICSYAV